MKRALITGITGQDGSYLAEFLLEKNYRVFGLVRHDSWYRPNCASHLADKVEVFFGDVTEGVDIAHAIQNSEPDEIYNLASQSRPSESWSRPTETLAVNGLAAVRLFEAARHNSPQARIYQASSSEMFGTSRLEQQDENTPFLPANPYAAAKVYAHQIAAIYRDGYGSLISSGIMFNHESERRPLHFLSQKIAHGAACAGLGIKNSPDRNERGHPIVENGKLALGNLDVARDWGYAPDFVEAMWLITQHRDATDFVIGTGTLRTLRDVCDIAYQCVGKRWQSCVFSDPALVRPLETKASIANPLKAQKVLGWKPRVTFEQMIQRMVEAQTDRLQRLL